MLHKLRPKRRSLKLLEVAVTVLLCNAVLLMPYALPQMLGKCFKLNSVRGLSVYTRLIPSPRICAETVPHPRSTEIVPRQGPSKALALEIPQTLHQSVLGARRSSP